MLEMNKHDLSKTWKILNSVIGRKKQNKLSSTFDVDGEKLKDPKIIANKFNIYFKNIGSTLAQKIPKHNKDPLEFLNGNYSNSAYFYPASENEVNNIIRGLKNSAVGWDEIGANMLKHTFTIITPLLTHLCNLSLATGMIPDQLKIAKVVPLYKGGAPGVFGNYRPVSVLPTISKIFEKLVYARIVDYLDKFSILSDSQFGFRKGRSTAMALTLISDKIQQEKNDKKFTVGVFLDLSKAFDTMDHGILMKKLYHYGIRGTAYDWISNYLSHRKQFVSYNDTKSDYENVTCGVPQGSILGPLLFLLYVNDIVNVSDIAYLLLYADDTNIFISDQCLRNATNNLNNELTKYNEWFQINKLSLNIAKTKAMVFTPSNRSYDATSTPIKIDNVVIEHVEHAKFLGVIIDNKLVWKQHITYICGKIAKNTGVIWRAREKLQTKCLLTLYTTLILPYFQYCIIVWGKTYQKPLNNLLKLQKKLVRIITFSEFNASTSTLFKQLSVMKVNNYYIYSCAIYMFKFRQGNLISQFDNWFVCNNDNHDYNTRHGNDYKSYRANTKQSSFNIRTQGPKIWNEIPRAVKDCQSLVTFKRKLKSHLLSIQD